MKEEKETTKEEGWGRTIFVLVGLLLTGIAAVYGVLVAIGYETGPTVAAILGACVCIVFHKWAKSSHPEWFLDSWMEHIGVMAAWACLFGTVLNGMRFTTRVTTRPWLQAALGFSLLGILLFLIVILGVAFWRHYKPDENEDEAADVADTMDGDSTVDFG